jgi:hypothetical protein
MAHVAAARRGHLEVAQRLVAGESVNIPGFDLDAGTPPMSTSREDEPLPKSWKI